MQKCQSYRMNILQAMINEFNAFVWGVRWKYDDSHGTWPIFPISCIIHLDQTVLEKNKTKNKSVPVQKTGHRETISN